MTQLNPEPSPDTQPENTTQAAVQPKKRRWLKYSAIGAALFFSGLLGGTYWLITSHSGLQFAVHRLPQLAGVRIQTQSLQGTIWHGFSGEAVVVNTDAADINIQSVKLQWQAKQLFNRHLHINELAVGDIRIKSKPVPPKPEQPAAQLPGSISLPVSVIAEKLSAGKIILVANNRKQTETVILDNIQARYVYDHQEHIAQIQTLNNEWSQSRGYLIAHTDSPFALKGRLLAKGQLDDIDVENILDISGSLKHIRIKTSLTGNGIGLYANTELRPFEPLLNNKISEVMIVGNGINPQAFNKALPFGHLTFKIEVHPDGNEQDNIALSGNIDLRNDKPESINNNAIPVKLLAGGFVVDTQSVVQLGGITAILMRDGRLALNGTIDTAKETLDLKADIQNVVANDVLKPNLQGKLNGYISVNNTFAEPQFNWQLNTGFADLSGSLNIATDTQHGQRTLFIKQAQITPKKWRKNAAFRQL